MIDLKELENNKDFFDKATADKGYDSSIVESVIEMNREFKKIKQEEESLISKRKDVEKENNKDPNLINIKEQIKELSQKRKEMKIELDKKLNLIPNPAFEDVPVGKNDKENVEIKTWGEKRNFTFKHKNHLELGEELGILNFEDGNKVAGSSFYFLDGDGVLLELALIQFTLKILTEHGFVPTITPDVARERFYLGTGYMPKGDEAQIYKLEGEDLGLIATSEITIAGRNADTVIPKEELPYKYAGLSHCFRKEAGSYGQYSKGLYRVHQFSKVEMFIYTDSDNSKKMHEEILKIEEEIWQKLGIPYRVLLMCTGDLGAIAAKKYDVEAWMPGREDYGEVTSASNCTDYQSRNLGIKIKTDKGNEYAHLLNGTAMAVSRGIIAVMENYQNEDGSIDIPDVLKGYMGKDKITKS